MWITILRRIAGYAIIGGMSPRRLPHSARPTPPRLAESASAAAAQILRRKLDPHRIASYGEVREYHTHRRWWGRRWMLALTIFALCYPVNHSLYVALAKHNVLTVSPNGAQAMSTATVPLVILRRECGIAEWSLDLLDDGCDAIVRLSLGKATLMEVAPVWMLYALPLLVVAAYSLSPVRCGGASGCARSNSWPRCTP
jgi:hypothetical protein